MASLTLIIIVICIDALALSDVTIRTYTIGITFILVRTKFYRFIKNSSSMNHSLQFSYPLPLPLLSIYFYLLPSTAYSHYLFENSSYKETLMSVTQSFLVTIFRSKIAQRFWRRSRFNLHLQRTKRFLLWSMTINIIGGVLNFSAMLFVLSSCLP